MTRRDARLPAASAVRETLCASLERTLATMAEAARQTREGATHEDSRAEGDKDMRSTEQSYLARGQAMRVEDLVEQIQRLRALVLPETAAGGAVVVTGSVVLVDVEGTSRVLFVVPWGGGTVLRVGGIETTVIAPSSPVGAALVGKRVGDSFELRVRGAVREWSIEAIG